eukprot:CAMPEP_0176114166 /NCGR_PEP_ID=MMETSP0120_2-20121206/57330_1 /TAXON_ID=160619 /ORGANISM="Kryptoperidinium foliaceum, Strain CCMP 1326" /LENGTH=68 /DNA_ID=CAMNT_0017448393 /DNA_START=18 /DNA_END=221 /DNA_ORIENTATION=-
MPRKVMVSTTTADSWAFFFSASWRSYSAADIKPGAATAAKSISPGGDVEPGRLPLMCFLSGCNSRFVF